LICALDTKRKNKGNNPGRIYTEGFSTKERRKARKIDGWKE
jgi:hypothetical protein